MTRGLGRRSEAACGARYTRPVIRIVSPRPGRAALAGLVLIAALAAVAVARCRAPGPPPPLAFATFNIEDFPKDARQIDGAFALLAELDADVVALQEIIDPSVFLAEVHARLGSSWRFVHTGQSPRARLYPRRRTGVLYDGRAWDLAAVAVHEDTRAVGGAQPVLDVRLAPRAGGAVLRVVVVHLLAGSDNRARRAREHAALAALLASTRDPAERLLVAGDFNATEPADRDDLAALAAAADLTWATEPLPCSAFWRRHDDCPTSRLDHVFSSAPPASTAARGACQTHGCATRDRCPTYREVVSDHCPILVTLP
jgi:endonuclease/exonuclease/phosphatase family metal-dependent hydrolase